MLSLQPCEVCCYVVFCRVQPIFNHHYKITYLCQNTTTTNYVIYLFRFLVLLSVSILGYIVKCYLCPCVRVPCLVVFRYVWIYPLIAFSLIQSFICMYIQDITPHAARVLLIQDTINVVLCYCDIQADFLLECSVFPILFAFRTIFQGFCGLYVRVWGNIG